MLPKQMPEAAPTSMGSSSSQDQAVAESVDSGHPIELPDMTLRGSDRRAAVRLRFPHKQFVAPYHGGCIPSRASFKEVVCRDLSEQGFSFLATCPPDFEMLVVALGVAPNLTYMTARIVNRIRVSDGPMPLYRVGCRFTGRLS